MIWHVARLPVALVDTLLNVKKIKSLKTIAENKRCRKECGQKLPNFNITVVLVFHFLATVASLDRGNGQPENPDDCDFELIFRKTQHTSYVKHDMNSNDNWVSHFTVCAWIHTPDLQQSQKMTVISILIEKNGGNQNVVRLGIDGQGNIFFSFGSGR